MHFTEKQIALLIEGFDLLKENWAPDDHAETLELEKLGHKLRRLARDPLDHERGAE